MPQELESVGGARVIQEMYGAPNEACQQLVDYSVYRNRMHGLFHFSLHYIFSSFNAK